MFIWDREALPEVDSVQVRPELPSSSPSLMQSAEEKAVNEVNKAHVQKMSRMEKCPEQHLQAHSAIHPCVCECSELFTGNCTATSKAACDEPRESYLSYKITSHLQSHCLMCAFLTSRSHTGCWWRLQLYKWPVLNSEGHLFRSSRRIWDAFVSVASIMPCSITGAPVPTKPSSTFWFQLYSCIFLFTVCD